MTLSTARPLWAILLKASNPGQKVIMDCDECFSILEYLADTMHHHNKDFKLLAKKIRRHLSGCPDCHQHFLEKLKQLEQSHEAQQNDNKGT